MEGSTPKSHPCRHEKASIAMVGRLIEHYLGLVTKKAQTTLKQQENYVGIRQKTGQIRKREASYEENADGSGRREDANAKMSGKQPKNRKDQRLLGIF